ncbi:arylesterase [Desulfocurvus vexinensis]|uniref:arylesterase n=1 Tax=Desulfocurvus vexinensis TaxID=399548 RepID=UPI0004B28248|nr:arylesterase [Desulfocurvus vexinensis]
MLEQRGSAPLRGGLPGPVPGRPGRAAWARALGALALAALLTLALGPLPAARAAGPQATAAPTTPAASEDTMSTPRPVTLLAVGDSLTAGYGLPASAALPAVVEALLRQEGLDVRIVNAGVSGDTTSGGLARLPWLLEERPDCAWLALGANDGLRGQDPALMEANLDAMLELFAARGVPVLLIGMRAMENYGADYAARFDAVFPRVAARHGVPLHPFLLDGVALDPALNQDDGIHPNERGVAVIARALLPGVRALVQAAARP